MAVRASAGKRASVHQACGDHFNNQGRAPRVTLFRLQIRMIIQSRERCELFRPFQILRFQPCRSKSFLMHGRPFHHESKRSRSQLSLDQPEGFDVDDSLIPAVLCMKMRRRVIVKMHLDHNPVKPAQFRHRRDDVSNLETDPQPPCR